MATANLKKKTTPPRSPLVVRPGSLRVLLMTEMSGEICRFCGVMAES
jgi:hypothetical protein